MKPFIRELRKKFKELNYLINEHKESKDIHESYIKARQEALNELEALLTEERNRKY